MGPVEIKGMILAAAMLVGGLCIFLGYRLYVKGVLEKGHLDARGGGWGVVLKDYGPGVVFALFGAAIVVFAVTRDLSSTATKTTKQIPPKTGVVWGPLGTQQPSEVVVETETLAESASDTVPIEPAAATGALAGPN